MSSSSSFNGLSFKVRCSSKKLVSLNCEGIPVEKIIELVKELVKEYPQLAFGFATLLTLGQFYPTNSSPKITELTAFVQKIATVQEAHGTRLDNLEINQGNLQEALAAQTDKLAAQTTTLAAQTDKLAAQTAALAAQTTAMQEALAVQTRSLQEALFAVQNGGGLLSAVFAMQCEIKESLAAWQASRITEEQQ